MAKKPKDSSTISLWLGNFLLAALCSLLFLLPSILIQEKPLGIFQDPDGYTWGLHTLERIENGTWRNKWTQQDYAPLGTATYWSSLPAGYHVLGTQFTQQITGQPLKLSFEIWARWSNLPLLILGSGLLGATLARSRRDWKAIAITALFVSLPITHLVGNFNHPDHHVWILYSLAIALAGFLEGKAKTIGLSLAILSTVSPLSALITLPALGLGCLLKPQSFHPQAWLWTSLGCLGLYFFEYSPGVSPFRLDTPNLLIPAGAILLAWSLSQKTLWPITAFTVATGLWILWQQENILTLLDPGFRSEIQGEGWEQGTHWLNPLQWILLAFPLIRIFQKKFQSEEAPMAGATISTFLAATAAYRALELLAGPSILWARNWNNPHATKYLFSVALVFALLLCGLPQPKTGIFTAAKSAGEDILKASGPNQIILSNPTLATAIAWHAQGKSAGSHHWETWPERQELLHILRNPQPKEAKTLLQHQNITWIAIAPAAEDVPKRCPLLQLLAKETPFASKTPPRSTPQETILLFPLDPKLP